jgi:hypothetical protein
MTDHRTIILATATSSGATASAFMECLRAVNWQNVLTVLVSIASTLIALYVSARSAKREQDRLDRQAVLQDEIAAMVVRQNPSPSSNPQPPKETP